MLIAVVVVVRQSIDDEPANESFAVLQEPEGEFTAEKEAVVVLSDSGAAPEDITGWGEGETGAGGELTIFEYEDVICMVESPRGPKLCGATSLAERGELFLASPVSCDEVRVTGLVPDGIDEVELEQEGRAAQRVPVVSNIYEAELPTVETTVSAEGQSGVVRLPLGPYAGESPGCRRL